MSWKEIEGWFDVFIAYRTYTLLMHSFLLIWTTYQIVTIIKYAGKLRLNRVVNQSLIIIFLAELLRVFEFAFDPYSINDMMPVWADTLIFNLPFLLWENAAILILLYWAEVVQSTGYYLQSISKLRPALITFAILSSVVFLPVCIWYSLLPGMYSNLAYVAIFGIIFLLVIILSCYYGIKLIRLTKISYQSSQSEVFMIYLRKITLFLFTASGSLIAAMITMTIFTLLSAYSSAWLFVSFHALYRTEEFCAIFSMLLLLDKQKPVESSKDGSSECETSLSRSTSYPKSGITLDVEVLETKIESTLAGILIPTIHFATNLW